MMPIKEPFEAAAQRAYPALIRSAAVLCWARSDAEDVVQETLLRAFKSYDSFRGGSSFLTWAYAILARVAQTANVKRARAAAARATIREPAELPAVDESLIASEEARAVIDAIRALAERQREMITLFFLEELSYGEIAEALHVSVGTVKATLFQAKASLRSTLLKSNPPAKANYAVP